MTKKLIFIVVSFLLSLSINPVYAKTITRTCNAMYKMTILKRVNGKYQILDIRNLYGFKAKGSCGSTVPNRCRQRAKEAALQCMEYHVNNDFDTRYPKEEYELQASGHRYHQPYYCSMVKLKVSGYNIFPSLLAKAKEVACVVDRERTDFAYVGFDAIISGKKGCATKRKIPVYLPPYEQNKKWYYRKIKLAACPQ